MMIFSMLLATMHQINPEVLLTSGQSMNEMYAERVFSHTLSLSYGSTII